MRKRILQIILFLMLLSLGGCGFFEERSSSDEIITVYFYNDQTGTLEGEKVPYENDENSLSEDRLIATIEALYSGPQTKGQMNKPIDFHIREANLKGNRAYIDFSSEYNKLDAKQQMIYRASLVWSITEIPYIDDVEFSIEGEPLKTTNGVRIGELQRTDIVINVLDPNPPTKTQTIVLYFPKEGSDKLYPEQRTIQVNNSIPLEEYIVDELIKGPYTEGLLAVLPKDTKRNSIKTQESICQVDLPYALNMTQNTSVVQESLVVYSMVNSLTELTHIQKVVFLKDGQKQTEFSTNLTETGTFERNEEIIAESL